MNLNKDFKRKIIASTGDKGKVWLDNLPNLLLFLTKKWGLHTIIPFHNLSYNFVARAYSNVFEKDVVLKLGVCNEEIKQEANALTFFDGIGCVRLLDTDFEYGTLLLEMLTPGITLESYFPQNDDEAVKITCEVMNKLHLSSHKTQDLNFKAIDEWFTLFNRIVVAKDIKDRINLARKFEQELKNTSERHYVLHGDLHHDNILRDRDTYRAIDPKGIVGEVAYEIGSFMCNPSGLSKVTNLKALLKRRVSLFSQILGIDKERIIKACYIRIMLSICWTIEEKGNWRNDLSYATLILELLVK